jgi:hypothetical protein
MDDRIIDFSKGKPVLPDRFVSKINVSKEGLNMILASGDGWGDDTRKRTNIEKYKDDYDIFCCLADYNKDGLNANIQYLAANPQLNIVLCLFNIFNEIDCDKLLDLFSNKIKLINTDDTRVYLQGGISYRLLVEGGICENVTRLPGNGTEGRWDDASHITSYLNLNKGYHGYDEPFFEKIGDRKYKKLGTNLLRGGKIRKHKRRKTRNNKKKQKRKSRRV